MRTYQCVRILLFALLVFFQTGLPLLAAPLDEALKRFSEDSFSETEKAIGEIALSGDDNAAKILEALQAARLFVGGTQKNTFYKDASGQVFNAATGETVAAPTDLAVVRLNNRLRRSLEAAIGSLTLFSSDPLKRQSAAESVFRSRDVSMLEPLRGALAKEQNPKIRKLFAEAEAAIVLMQAETASKPQFDALTTLRARGDQDAIAVLRTALPLLKNSDLRTGVDSAIAEIEARQRIIAQVQNVWFGLSLGSVLLLAAIGLAITFGVMGVINMAHGEMVMIGAYTTFVVQEAFRAYAPAYFGWSLPLAIPLAFLIAGLIGVLIERGIIRFLYGRPLETLLATWGVSLILQQAVRTIFGPTNREVSAPSYMAGAFDVMGMSVTYGRLWIIIFTLVVFFTLLLVLKATPLGLQMRAVTQNRRMASSMGIRTPWVDAMTFGLGSGVAGIAGVALSQIDNVSPNLGQSYIIDSFMVVVFGGVGNLWGTLVSAFALGIANKFLEPLAGAVLAKITILVLLILFIQKRPRGLFALKGRAVEQ
ncbi:MAG: urea ABC transporter permease subunit UrtB [Beijerinckiaceae bacterium]